MFALLLYDMAAQTLSAAFKIAGYSIALLQDKLPIAEGKRLRALSCTACGKSASASVGPFLLLAVVAEGGVVWSEAENETVPAVIAAVLFLLYFDSAILLDAGGRGAVMLLFCQLHGFCQIQESILDHLVKIPALQACQAGKSYIHLLTIDGKRFDSNSHGQRHMRRAPGTESSTPIKNFC